MRRHLRTWLDAVKTPGGDDRGSGAEHTRMVTAWRNFTRSWDVPQLGSRNGSSVPVWKDADKRVYVCHRWAGPYRAGREFFKRTSSRSS
jgi:hypothetical protein